MIKKYLNIFSLILLFSDKAIATEITLVEFLDESKPNPQEQVPHTLRASEQRLLYTTTKIEVVQKDSPPSTGTGFFASLENSQGKRDTFLVTNKHVIFNDKEIKNIYIYFHALKEKKEQSTYYRNDYDLENSNAQSMCKVCFPAGFEKNFTSSCEADICAVWLNPLIEQFNQKTESTLYYEALNFDYEKMVKYRPNDKSIKFTVSSKITMIGYPHGYWDDINNFPILRMGHVASDPLCDHRGKKQYLIDIALFPGSSGSPVFMIKKEKKATESNSYMSQSGPETKKKIYFVGMVYGGPSSPLIQAINTKLQAQEKIIEANQNAIKGLQQAFEKLDDFTQIHANLIDRMREDINNPNPYPSLESPSMDDEESIEIKAPAEKKKRKRNGSKEEESKKSKKDDQEREEQSVSDLSDEVANNKLFKQFSNLAYVIKPDSVKSCIQAAQSNIRAVEYSNTIYYVHEQLERLRGKSLEELSKDGGITKYKI